MTHLVGREGLQVELGEGKYGGMEGGRAQFWR